MQTSTDKVVVIGSGLAGLTCALSLAPQPVLLVTKTPQIVSGSSCLAKGGLAAAIGPGDSVADHAADTVAAGAGLCNIDRVHALATEGRDALRWLQGKGIQFDCDGQGNLLLAKEAAHRCARVVHAGGDATGDVLMQELSQRIAESPSITVLNATFASDLLLSNGRVAGISIYSEQRGWQNIATSRVIIATGGIGMAWQYTTNPVESSGDGMAMAARAGAVLSDIEFMQFHPTAIASDAAGHLNLLTEALRGAGAVLLDDSGKPFMREEHVLGDLAPRDIVARAIYARTQSGKRVFLDIAPALMSKGAAGFPTAIAAAQQAGIDPFTTPIPVVPAAHYHMGGVQVDDVGRSTVDGLWVCGEAAASGIHGANRLASNSLLEAVVYGRHVAGDVSRSVVPAVSVPAATKLASPSKLDDVESRDIVAAIRQLMSEHVGIVRDATGLRTALRSLRRISDDYDDRRGEINNLLLVARLVTTAALQRTESRGSHFRQDYPKALADWQHSLNNVTRFDR